MINSYKSIKLQTRTYKKLMQIKKLYGFKALSDTIQMLIGNCEVKKLLTEEDIKQLAKTNDLIEIKENENENNNSSSKSILE